MVSGGGHMPHNRAKSRQKQNPPLQFRPGTELEELVATFADEHHLSPNEASKALVALAVTEMDRRFYPLIRRMAAAMGEPNAFVRACAHVRIALEGARLATARPMQL